MQETAVENPYGLGALIANGDIIARSILAILLIMSLLTWFIMITKFFDQGRQRRQAIQAEKEFWSSANLTDALGILAGGLLVAAAATLLERLMTAASRAELN